MDGKENARPVAGTTGRARQETAAGQAAISMPYCNMIPAGRQPRVADFLLHGRENALHLGELKQLLHKDGRTVRLMIQQERRYVPIVSDNKSGYWIGTLAEANAFARSMQVRAGEIQRTAAFVQMAALEAGSDG